MAGVGQEVPWEGQVNKWHLSSFPMSPLLMPFISHMVFRHSSCLLQNGQAFQ